MNCSSFIGGRFVPGTSGVVLDNLNPATGERIGGIELAGPAEAEQAVAAAARGWAHWSALTGTERGRILNRAAAMVRERGRALARLEVIDTGKPIQEAEAVDIPSAADCIEFFAGLAATLHGTHHELRNAFVYTRREPLGICAGIGAWNYPLQIACWKSAPALACGNAMIFKPAELTPTTAGALAEIYRDAGVPDGVFNVLQGDARTGQLLTRHPAIAKVSLTGECATGRSVMADAATTLKRVTMELGGKSPLIVFDDADLEQAVAGALMANFFTQGEVCTNGTRVFVHDALHDAFVGRLLARVARLKLGDPLDPSTQVGALISPEHLARVLGFVERGVAGGARLACGGRRPADPQLARGCFIEPAVFVDCRDEMEIVREEIFGPVMSVLRFHDEDEVVRRANATPYGLAAGVFTRDLARGHRVIGRIDAGVCWINNYNVTPVEVPFGGFKQSGIGQENGHAAVDHYTRVKSVYVELGQIACPY